MMLERCLTLVDPEFARSSPGVIQCQIVDRSVGSGGYALAPSLPFWYVRRPWLVEPRLL